MVKESRIAQISGKMLIASRSTIVGAMNSQAIERSESPRALPREALRRLRGHAIGESLGLILHDHGHLDGSNRFPGEAIAGETFWRRASWSCLRR